MSSKRYTEQFKVEAVQQVIGAGHLAGLQKELLEQHDPPLTVLEPLNAQLPAPRWPKWFALGIMLAIFVAMAFIFHRSTAQGYAALRDWVVFTGCLSALGALIAGAHPLSILTAFVVGPLKPIRPPGLSSGVFAGMVEAWLRKPRVGDFQALRDDLLHTSG